MDIYDQMIEYFSNIPHADEWKELQTLFRRVATAKPGHWLMPVRACEAVGGTAEQAISAATAFACSHISIILVDDMLDSDPRGEHQRVGMPAAANMACALQAAGLDVIARGENKARVKLAALYHFNRMFLTTALGQLWDVKTPADEADYWRIVRTKSSPFFGSTLQIGGLLGGATLPVAARLRDLGCLYGEMIQIHDDLNDVMEVPANPDWTEGRSPLPILFARLVDHRDRSRFLELQRNIFDPLALEEAQEILIRCGAVSYCVYQLLYRYKNVQDILASMTLARKDILDAVFEDVIAPVWKLFEAIGETLPELSMLQELEHHLE
jgi:geranylgeranyl pyrophosphate synthase